jgi:hypothetical protein
VEVFLLVLLFFVEYPLSQRNSSHDALSFLSSRHAIGTFHGQHFGADAVHGRRQMTSISIG